MEMKTGEWIEDRIKKCVKQNTKRQLFAYLIGLEKVFAHKIMR